GTVTPALPQTLSIIATVASPAAQTNTSTVSHADQFDPNTANNTASVTETPQQATSGDDVLVANSSGAQILDGLAGNDTLVGQGSGTYQLNGDDGNDSILATGSGAETLSGGNGNDTLQGLGAGTYQLDGGSGDNALYILNGVTDATLFGGAGSGNDT